MENEEQVVLLKQGSWVWNEWREENPDAEINLSGANLGGVDLSFANLNSASLGGANLFETNLHYANLSDANLSFAYLHEANLHGACLSKANLSGANLSGANLSSADLSFADLSFADLSNTDLSRANLHSVNLFRGQVLDTNFRGATLTGACIEDWQIGSTTILEDVQCDYIFRTYDYYKLEGSGRLPVDPGSTFASGEFTKRFQIIASALETIDITFTEGIDWQAFFQSFQAVKRQYPDKNIAVQGMDAKAGAFVVRLEVDAEETGSDLEQLKANIETKTKQLYSTGLALREAQGQLKVYREMMGVVQALAGKPMGDQHFHAPVGNVAQTNHGKMQNVQHIYAPEQRDLSKAAKEIQALLNTLAETYNTTSDTGKEKLLQKLNAEVEKHPKWRRALKEGGIELAKVLFPPIGVPLEMARVYLDEE